MEIIPTPTLLPGPVAQGTNPGDGAGDAARAATDFNTFLTLLTAQLRNQDPLQPLDSTEFVAQLANFSTVEQLIDTNAKIEALAAQSAAGDIAALSTWIGRDVTAANGIVRATGSAVAFAVPHELEGQRLEAVLREADGREIDRIPLSDTPGDTLFWSGLDAQGNPVAGRDVTISLRLQGASEDASEIPALVFRQVTGLRGTDAGLVLDLADGGSLPAEQVAELRAR